MLINLKLIVLLKLLILLAVQLMLKRKFVIFFSGERGQLLETLPLTDQFNHALLATIMQVAQLDAVFHATETISIQFNDAVLQRLNR